MMHDMRLQTSIFLLSFVSQKPFAYQNNAREKSFPTTGSLCGQNPKYPLKCPHLVFYPTINPAILGSQNTLFIKALEVKFQKNLPLRFASRAPSAPPSLRCGNQLDYPDPKEPKRAQNLTVLGTKPSGFKGIRGGGGGLALVFD